MEGIYIVVRGRVQGVGFRWWAWRLARELELTGTVRNRPDGSVELYASGSPGALDSFVNAIRIGPPGSLVYHVSEASSSFDSPSAGFVILR